MAYSEWTPDEDQWIIEHPSLGYPSYLAAGFANHSRRAFFRRKVHLLHSRREERRALESVAEGVHLGKVRDVLHWTDVLDAIETMQNVADLGRGSQEHGTVVIEGDKPVAIGFISDWHMGSWGTDYRKLAELTTLILQHDLKLAVLGDMVQMSISLRNVLEQADNLLPPRMQMQFLESWLDDMEGRILWATWDNHSVEREERATGFSRYADLFKDRTIFHNGIGHIDLVVGEETYKIATSHRFRGNTATTAVGGQIRYMRMEAPDREIVIAGDSHRPALYSFYDGAAHRYAINCGSLQTGSGYAKRYFSLHTNTDMPVLVFYPGEHRVVPFLSMEDWVASGGLGSEPKRVAGGGGGVRRAA